MENGVCPTNKRSDVSKRKSENKNKSFHIVAGLRPRTTLFFLSNYIFFFKFLYNFS